jgi:AbiJ N-terminal domain 4
MAILDIFSKRQARLRGDVPDVYRYDTVPKKLRVQLVHIIKDLIHGGVEQNLYNSLVQQAYIYISKVLCREYGLFRLAGESYQPRDYASELFNFLLGTENYEHVLDVVELSAKYADLHTRKYEYLYQDGFDTRVNRAIEELNGRFKEHGIGYQYEDGQLVRVDSDLLHAEAVKPALTLLRTQHYAGPREEFLRAYEHYRHGRHEEALTEALKSFESTMKAICDVKKWSYDKNSPAKKLVDVCFKNNLIDAFWQTHFAHLQGSLENGIATARNKLGGHGQGAQPRTVPRAIVSYVLHMTASTIVFLIESAGS